jgi:LEA14-like dessication related protein
MKKLLFFLLVIAAIIIGIWVYFLRTFKEPVFIAIRDLQVVKLENEMAEISAIAVLNNPNAISAQLLNTELKAYSNEILIASVSQTHISDIPAESNFDIPLKFSVNLLKLGMSQSISGVLENIMNEERIIPVRFEGYCRIRNKEHTFKIPVTYEDKIRFK